MAESKSIRDAFFVVFHDVDSALAAAIQAQRELHSFPWPPGHPLRVRMGLHYGAPTLIERNYVGLDLHRGARLMSAGHGGQILLSGVAAALLSRTSRDYELRDRGEHRLKDLLRAEHIFEIAINGLPTDFAPLRTLNHRPHNLPTGLLPILGREREIESISARLQSETRLATLLGPGGTGKTRLALEIAALTLDRKEDGVFFVPLAPVPLPDAALSPDTVQDAIAGAVARELGLHDDGTQSIGEQLLDFLKTRKLLLVLDNFEHLLSGAAIVARWLAHCPHLQILATSRVPLHLSGEQQIPVAPLALPRRQPLPDIASLSQHATVALFIERAQAVRPDFSLNEANAPAIVEICARLDGLPLAIELAAARIKILPPQTLLARLGNGLSFLVGGVRDVAARQQTLRAAIAWSYDLLGEDEKLLFRRLGVFRGGFTFASAEQVCADASLQCDVFEAVSSLLNQSLLVSYEDMDGETRFGMLETIREFAMETLEAAGETETLRARHLEWCCSQTNERDTEMVFDLARALRRFEIEANNWRAAWNWSIGARPEDALRLAANATLLWNRIGGTIEQYERLEISLQAAPAGEAKDRCRALHFLVQADRNRTNWTRYAVWVEQLERLAHEAQLPEFQAIALDQRMWDAVKEGRIEAALEHSEAIVKLRRSCLEQAKKQALSAHEIERCELEITDAMILQVEILVKAGRIEEAHVLMAESLARKRASRDESGLIFGLNKYGQFLADIGQFGEARPIFEEAVRRAEAIGDRSIVLAWYRHDAALMALHQGDVARARELLRAAYAVLVENAAASNFLLMLHILVYLHGLEANWPLVARTLGAGDAARGEPCPDDWREILQAQENAARTALGDAEFEAQRANGARLEAQPAIEAALL